MLHRLVGSVRQWFFPKEFRIAAPLWPPEWKAVRDRWLEQSAARFTAPKNTDGKSGGKVIATEETVRLLADLATGIWRLRQRFAAHPPQDELRRATRDLDSLWDALTQAGVEVQDHNNALYDAGQSLRVVAFQPTPGIDRERIVETIKPTVYYQSQWIQMGEVIVGTPESAAAPQTSEKDKPT
jgi:hypothetical protein